LHAGGNSRRRRAQAEGQRGGSRWSFKCVFVLAYSLSVYPYLSIHTSIHPYIHASMHPSIFAPQVSSYIYVCVDLLSRGWLSLCDVPIWYIRWCMHDGIISIRTFQQQSYYERSTYMYTYIRTYIHTYMYICMNSDWGSICYLEYMDAIYYHTFVYM
jgi:hypothetical protein